MLAFFDHSVCTDLCHATSLVHAPDFFVSCDDHHLYLHSFPTRRSSDLSIDVVEVVIWRESSVSGGSGAVQMFLRWQQRKPRSEERFSRNAETDLVCRLLLEKKKQKNNK